MYVTIRLLRFALLAALALVCSGQECTTVELILQSERVGRAGEPYPFEIHVFGADGLPCQSNSTSPIRISCTTTEGAEFCNPGLIDFVGAGIYNATIIPTYLWGLQSVPCADRCLTLSGFYDEISATGNPYTIAVTAGEVSPALSSIEGLPRSRTVGSYNTIARWQPQDNFGNPILSGYLDGFLVEVSSPEIHIKVVDEGSMVIISAYSELAGIFAAQFWYTVSTGDRVPLLVQSLGGGDAEPSLEFEVEPGSLSHTNFAVSGLPAQVIAGRKVVISAQAQDSYGNPTWLLTQDSYSRRDLVSQNSSLLKAECNIRTSGSLTFVAKNEMDDTQRGLLHLTLQLQVAGEYACTTWFQDMISYILDQGSVLVMADSPSLMLSKLLLPDAVEAGQADALVELYDNWMNPSNDTRLLNLELIDVENGADLSYNIHGPILIGQGAYMYRVELQKAGEYRVRASLNGSVLKEKQVMVKANVNLSPIQTEVYGYGAGTPIAKLDTPTIATPLLAGRMYDIWITPRDMYGNVWYGQNSEILPTVLIDGIPGRLVVAPIGAVNGTLHYVYNLTTSGLYEITVFTDDKETALYSGRVAVQPDFLSPYNARITAAKQVSAGQIGILNIQFFDIYNNTVSVSGTIYVLFQYYSPELTEQRNVSVHGATNVSVQIELYRVGNCFITCYLNGEKLGRHGLFVTVLPSSPVRSKVSSNGRVQGGVLEVTFDLMDQFGNPASSNYIFISGLHISVQPGTLWEANLTKISRGSGYMLSMWTSPGNYTLILTYNGTSLLVYNFTVSGMTLQESSAQLATSHLRHAALITSVSALVGCTVATLAGLILFILSTK